jgi:hypothetical protein
MVVPECCHLHESQAWLYESSLFYPLLMIHRLGFVGGQLSFLYFFLKTINLVFKKHSLGGPKTQTFSHFSFPPWRMSAICNGGREKWAHEAPERKSLKRKPRFLEHFFSFIAVFLTGQRLRVRKSAMG